MEGRADITKMEGVNVKGVSAATTAFQHKLGII
jgi:hypothetical protein